MENNNLILRIVFIFLILVDLFVMIVLGLNIYITISVTLFSLIVYWLVLFKGSSLSKSEVTKDTVYVGKDGYEYNELSNVILDFKSNSNVGEHRNDRQVINSVNLVLYFNNGRSSKSLLWLRDRESMWEIITACRIYNETADIKIILSKIIPDTYEDFDLMLDKWYRRDPMFSEHLRKIHIEEYAEANGISFDEAQRKVGSVESTVAGAAVAIDVVSQVFNFMKDRK